MPPCVWGRFKTDIIFNFTKSPKQEWLSVENMGKTKQTALLRNAKKTKTMKTAHEEINGLSQLCKNYFYS